MSDKDLNIIGELSDVLRIESKLNSKREIRKRKSLTIEELQRIADSQGVKRRIEYVRRG